MRTRLALLVVIVCTGVIWTIWHGYQKGWFAERFSAFEKQVPRETPKERPKQSPEMTKTPEPAQKPAREEKEPVASIEEEGREETGRFHRDKTKSEQVASPQRSDSYAREVMSPPHYEDYLAPSMPSSYQRQSRAPARQTTPARRAMSPGLPLTTGAAEADGDAAPARPVTQPKQQAAQPAGQVVIPVQRGTGALSGRSGPQNRRLQQQVDELKARNESLQRQLQTRDREVEELKTLLTLLREESGKDLEFILKELERRGVTPSHQAQQR